ncbi:MAG TPA: glycosyltransferase family 4 protein [Blastocatellia bacterium]|nr:glycosyltransferase family 4 protein [Blastocatellia bacterium]
MTCTILNVAFPFAPVGQDAVGGAEQILTALDVAIVKHGWRSIVIACEGSNTAGTLITTPRIEDQLADETQRLARSNHKEAIQRALKEFSVDLIHMHGLDFNRYLPSRGTPVLATLHLPPAWYDPEIFHLYRPLTYINCVSAAQNRACPSNAVLLPAIENGVAVEQFVTRVRKRNFVVALGRICPEKGFHVAIEAAKLTNIPLLLAGEVFRYEAHEHYFCNQIIPRLDSRRRFIGPIGFARKRRLLSAARCLLVPSLVQETSSLVAMEALACGTPVVAFPAGALTEIIEHGKTGFLVKDEKEMAEAIEAAGTLDPDVCREAAQRRFSAGKMADRYFEIYEQLIREYRGTVRESFVEDKG